MISRIAGVATIALLQAINPLFACEDYALTAAQADYLKSLELPLAIPRADIADIKSQKKDVEPPAKRSCSISADFNGDGVEDFAGIFHYQGKKKRPSGWLLDLVVIYSDQGQLKHQVLPYAGRFTRDGDRLRQFLAVQPAGRIDLKPGQATLDHPGILSYRDGTPAVAHYWSGNRFTKRVYYIDD